MNKQRARILLADDHRLVAEGVRTILEPKFEVVGLVEDGRQLVESARKLKPDVIVADIAMPHLNGLDALVELKQDNPGVKVILLTMHRQAAYVRRAIETGAAGFVLKHSASEKLVAAIQAALDGRSLSTPAIASEVLRELRGGKDLADPAERLTFRQRQILQLMVARNSTKEIAGHMNISARTVEFHKQQMMEKLKVRSSADLLQFALKNGIAPLSEPL